MTTDDDGRGRAARAIHLDLENSSLNEPTALNVLNVSVQHLSCVEIPTELGPDESLRPLPCALPLLGITRFLFGRAERTNSRIFQGNRT